MWRAEDQEWDYMNELEYIEELIGESYEMEGEDLDNYIAAYGEADYNELKNRKDDLDEWLEAVEGEIAEYQEIAQEYTDAKAADAAARMIQAQEEELNRAAEQRAADEMRIKHEREATNSRIHEVNEEIE